MLGQSMCRSSSVAVSLSALAHCPQRLDVNGALLLRSGQRRYKVSCWQLAAALDCSNASFVTFCISLDDALALSLSFCSAFSVPSSVFLLCSSSLIHMLFFSLVSAILFSACSFSSPLTLLCAIVVLSVRGLVGREQQGRRKMNKRLRCELCGRSRLGGRTFSHHVMPSLLLLLPVLL